MGLFGKKKDNKPTADEENARLDAEFEAKFKAKQERKKIEKTINEIDASEQKLIAKAADAKTKGYRDVYGQCVTMIKVTRARKRQAEKFLFQMDAMQEMQSLSKGSMDLLNSIRTIADSLGKLSLDKSALMAAQKDFASVERELEKQSASLDIATDGFDSIMSTTDADFGDFADSSIDAEIESFIMGNSMKSGNGSFSSLGSSSGSSNDAELEDLKKKSMEL